MKRVFKWLVNFVEHNLLTLVCAWLVIQVMTRLISESIKLPTDIVVFSIAGAVMLITLAILMDEVINAGPDDRDYVEPTGVQFIDMIKGDVHEK